MMSVPTFVEIDWMNGTETVVVVHCGCCRVYRGRKDMTIMIAGQ